MSTGPHINRGIAAALGAALLFGAGTPLAKLLLHDVGPWMLAGLFYLGSGLGLTLWRAAIRAKPVRLAAAEKGWLAGAVLTGGVAGPLLLMKGLTRMPASGASLLLNAEGVFTALLAWFAFKENVDRRIALGMFSIAGGAVLLSWPGEARFSGMWPAVAILGACLAWGIDNNLTRKISLNDATWIASVKGLVAGSVNLGLAFAAGERFPSLENAPPRLLCGISGLRGEPRSVRCRAAPPRYGPNRGLLFDRPILWSCRRPGLRRDADRETRHFWTPHGRWSVAPSHREACPRAHPRSD